jgi:hypothetical protein
MADQKVKKLKQILIFDTLIPTTSFHDLNSIFLDIYFLINDTYLKTTARSQIVSYLLGIWVFFF